jgi:hypothetical protein
MAAVHRCQPRRFERIAPRFQTANAVIATYGNDPRAKLARRTEVQYNPMVEGDLASGERAIRWVTAASSS